MCAMTAGQIMAQTDRIMADVLCDGVSQGRALVVVRDGRVLMSRDDVRRIGIGTGSEPCDAIDGRCFVPLARLKRQVSYSFDPQTFTLKIATDPGLLPRRTVTVMETPQPGENRPVTGVVVNYGIHAAPGSALSGSLDGRFNIRSNVVAESTFGRTTTGAFARGSSSVTIDSPQNMRRLVAGDTTLDAGPLGTPFSVGGFSVSREFSLDPYQPAFPMPAMQTTVTQPSVADIYVDGVLVRSMDLAPGNYNLADIPVRAGYTDARVVIRNQFGAQSNDLVQYGAPLLLRKGLTDYQYGVGFERSPQTDGNGSYGPLAASLRYRIGVSSASTVGGALQATAGQVAAAVNYGAVWRFGYVEADAGAASADGHSGTALLFRYTTSGIRSAASFQARFETPDYRPAGADTESQAPRSDLTASDTERIDANTTLSLAAHSALYRTGEVVRNVALSLTRRLRDWSAVANYEVGGVGGPLPRNTNNISITLTRSLGSATTQTLSTQSGASAAISTSISHAAATPFSPSYAVGLADTQGLGKTFSGRFTAGLPFATATISGVTSAGGSATFDGDFTGALLLSNGPALYSQQIGDAYAVVDAGGVQNSPVFLNGRYAGRTNKAGYALIPFLGSGEITSIGLSADALPLDDAVTTNDRRVVAGYHAGSSVHFGIHRLHAILGTLRIVHRNASRIPAYGQATIMLAGENAQTSPIDETGRFYFDGVPAGTYSVTVADSDGNCTFELHVPTFTERARDLGRQECRN